MMRLMVTGGLGCALALACVAKPVWPAAWAQINPYELQIREAVEGAEEKQPEARRVALQNLGFLRAYGAAEKIAQRLSEADATVRRAAAASLGLCGRADQLNAQQGALDDPDVWVRQSAAVALSNLTGEEPAFNAFAAEAVRREQAAAWQRAVEAAQRHTLRLERVADAAEASWLTRCRAARALGAVGVRASGVPLLQAALAP